MLIKKFLKKNKPSNQEIYPDQIFLDSSNAPNFNRNCLEGNLEKTISKKIGYGVLIFSILICSIFISKLWKLEIKNHISYKTRSETNYLRHALIFTQRGRILDRNGKVMVENGDNDISDNFKLRRYENTKGVGNIIGFVKYPQKDSAGYFYQIDIKGMSGIEKTYNEVLAGENGIKIVEVDALNNIQSEGIYQKPENGKDIRLSIDLDLSEKLYDLIENTSVTHNFSGGAGIIMDTNTGEIIALSSFPDYDPQILTDGKDTKAIKDYSEDERKPYLNKVINGLYTPGSIIKPFLAIGVLNEKIIDPYKTILSTGSISIPNEYDPTKKSVFNDWKAHGEVDMRKALAVSSNVYFYEVGGGYENQIGLGINKIENYLRLFGFGAILEDRFLSGEKGTIPNPQWKELNFPNDPWRIGDTYNTSIGQYGLQVTPIQVVRAMSAIANNGKIIEPVIIFQDGSMPIKKVDIGISERYFKTVREGLRQAVTEGTASGLNIPQVKIAAKTGTAEVGTIKKFVNSWVTGFFPYENPRYAFAILMEKGPRDNTIGALFVMRQFLEWASINKPEILKH